MPSKKISMITTIINRVELNVKANFCCLLTTVIYFRMSWESKWEYDINSVDFHTSSRNTYKPEEAAKSLLAQEPLTNLTLEYCSRIYENVTNSFRKTYPEGFCEVTFDGILCWPPTALNVTAVNKCFKKLMNVDYDDTRK